MIWKSIAASVVVALATADSRQPAVQKLPPNEMGSIPILEYHVIGNLRSPIHRVARAFQARSPVHVRSRLSPGERLRSPREEDRSAGGTLARRLHLRRRVAIAVPVHRTQRRARHRLDERDRHLDRVPEDASRLGEQGHVLSAERRERRPQFLRLHRRRRTEVVVAVQEGALARTSTDSSCAITRSGTRSSASTPTPWCRSRSRAASSRSIPRCRATTCAPSACRSAPGRRTGRSRGRANGRIRRRARCSRTITPPCSKSPAARRSSPFDPKWIRTRIPRVEVWANELEKEIDRLDKKGDRYVSAGSGKREAPR